MVGQANNQVGLRGLNKPANRKGAPKALGTKCVLANLRIHPGEHLLRLL